MNACFCPWAFAGGFLAAWLTVGAGPERLPLRHGLSSGALVGAWTAVITAISTLASWVFVSRFVPPDDSLGPFARITPTLDEALSEGALFGLVWGVAAFAATVLGALAATLLANRSREKEET